MRSKIKVDFEEVYEMRNLGWTWNQIAHHLGYTSKAGGTALRERYLLWEAKQETGKYQVTRKEVDTGKIGALYKAGWNSGKIAAEMDISVERVRHELDKMGLRGGLIGV